ncbi:MAG: hypothetical protein ABIR08_02890 [Sphingomonas sp.]
MAKAIEDVFEDKARAGDGQFAIAFALMALAREHERLANKVGQIGFDGPANNMGALEYIGVRLGDVASALECLTVNASVSGSMDINNG